MNKILIIDSGLKHSDEVLNPYINRLNVYLLEENQIVDLRNPLTFDERTFFSYNQIIFIFSTAMDTLPSSLLEIFEKIDSTQKNNQEIYSLILCDEYEPEKCNLSARIIKKWAEKNNLIYKGSMQIGSSLLMEKKRRFIVASSLKRLSKMITHHEDVNMKMTYSTLSNFMKVGNQYWHKEIKKKQKELKKMSR